MHARSSLPAHAAPLDENDWSTPAQLQDLSFLCDDDVRGPALRDPSRKEGVLDCAFTRLRALGEKTARFFDHVRTTSPR
jgi:hypothetical protein